MSTESFNLSSGAADELPQDAGQMAQLSKEELQRLAGEFGLDVTRLGNRQELAAALEQRRRMIGELDAEAMMEVIRWGHRSVPINASKERLAR
jgi:hypothetical protein